MNDNNFIPWNGNTPKKHYDVKTSDGELIIECWPNAGKMCATDGSNRKWLPEDDILIRESVDVG